MNWEAMNRREILQYASLQVQTPLEIALLRCAEESDEVEDEQRDELESRIDGLENDLSDVIDELTNAKTALEDMIDSIKSALNDDSLSDDEKFERIQEAIAK